MIWKSFFLLIASMAITSAITLAQESDKGPPELQAAKAEFQTRLRAAYAPYSNKRIPLKYQYLQGLRQHETNAKSAGDLDALEAIRREIKRFTNYQKIEDDRRRPLPGPAEAHFQRFNGLDNQLMNEWSQRRPQLNAAYARELAELQKALTIENRIDDAVVVKNAIERINEVPIGARTRPGLAAGATPLNYTLPAEVRARLERSRWELIWSGGKDAPNGTEFMEFHYGNILRYQRADGRVSKYRYSISDDLNITTSSKYHSFSFDPSWSLMDFNDSYGRSSRRGRLVGKIEAPASANMLQDILLYYPLDEVAPMASDKGPLGNHANPVNTSTVHFGKRGNAWQFDGYTSNLTVQQPIDVNALPEFTVACWFRIQKLERRAKLFQWNETDPDSGTYFSFEERNRIRFKTGTGESKTRFDYIEKTFEPKTWHHLALCYNARGAVRLYIDAQLVKSMAAPKLANNDTTLIIGGTKGRDRHYNTFFNGWIDEFFVFKRALSPSEVKTLYEFAEK